MKYYHVLKKEGYGEYEFMSHIRSGHIVECYRLDDSFLKIAPPNINTKGFKSEYDILKKIEHLSFVPKAISYQKVDGLEILVLSYLDGTPLNKTVYKKEHDKTILSHIKQLFDINIVHGDIKEDNVLILKDLVFLIDYDQSYEIEEGTFPDFKTSPDIIGNKKGLNYTKLMETVKCY